MKTSRFTDSQIIAILKQAEAGTPVPERYREHGMSNASFYKWRNERSNNMYLAFAWPAMRLALARNAITIKPCSAAPISRMPAGAIAIRLIDPNGYCCHAQSAPNADYVVPPIARG